MLSQSKNDTTKINLLNQLAMLNSEKNDVLTQKYLESAISLAQKINFLKGLTQTYYIKGGIFYRLNNSDSAKAYFEKSANVAKINSDEKSFAMSQALLSVIEIQKGNLKSGNSSFKIYINQLKRLNAYVELARAYNAIGSVYTDKGNYTESLNFLFEAREIFDSLKNLRMKRNVLVNIGNVFLSKHDYVEAQKNFLEALHLAEQDSDIYIMAACYNNIGNIYYFQNNYEKAMEYFVAAKKLHTKINNIVGIYDCILNIGAICANFNENKKALENYFEALRLAEQNNDLKIISDILVNVGLCYEREKNFYQAHFYYKRALEVEIKRKNRSNFPFTYFNLGNSYLNLNQKQKAIECFLTSFNLSLELGDKNISHKTSEMLATVFEAQADYKNALKFFKINSSYKDSLFNEKNSQIINELQVKYESENKEKNIVLLQNELKINEIQAKKNQIILYLLILGSILMFAILALGLYFYRKKQKYLSILKLKNTLISQQKLELENEKRKTDNLIVSILPEEKILEVREKGKLNFQDYEMVTNLFQKMEQAKMKSEFEALRNEVNPHFLYNTFNVLISLIEENSAIGVKYVKHLASVYRYVSQSKNREMVELVEEMEFLKSYEFLLSIKYSQNLIIQENLSADTLTEFIVPLALQMLVENAIKHNLISSSKPLYIDIFSAKDEIVVKNNLQKKNCTEFSSGIGLKNIIELRQIFHRKTCRSSMFRRIFYG